MSFLELAARKAYDPPRGKMPAEKKPESALNGIVVRLGIVSFFADVSTEMLYPITPLFLTSILGASMASVGLVEGCAEASASIMKLYAGRLSDRWRVRRPFVFAGYLLAGLAKPFMGFARSWPDILLARSADRVGKGLRTAPRDALLAEAVVEGERGLAFGWHRAMDSAGAALGPLFALFFISTRPADLRSIYFWAAIPGIFAALLVLTVPERKPDAPAVKPKSSEKLPAPFRRYLWIWVLFSLGNSSDAFLLLRAKEMGFSAGAVVLLYCVFQLAQSLLSPVLGRLSDLWGRKRLLVGGLACFALVYAGFAFAKEGWQLWLLFAAYGAYMAGTDGVGKAFAVDLVPKDAKGAALGALASATGLAVLVASLLAGELWDHLGHQAPFLLGSVAALLACVAFILGLPFQDKAPASA